MSMEPHSALGSVRPDVIAECWDGVSCDLYLSLWASVRHLKGYDGETPPEPDVNSVASIWDRYDDWTKRALNALAEKAYPEITPLDKAIAEAQAADDAFQAELVRLFGRAAGDRRYDATHRGWSDRAIELGRQYVEASERMSAAFERARGEG